MKETEINISKYKNHQKKVPWPLIFKIVIAGIIIVMLFWVNKTEKKVVQGNEEEKIELIFD